jgi:hypothetical protein
MGEAGSLKIYERLGMVSEQHTGIVNGVYEGPVMAQVF